jgi:hypothetical protein
LSRCEHISYIEIEGEGTHAGGGERREDWKEKLSLLRWR